MTAHSADSTIGAVRFAVISRVDRRSRCSTVLAPLTWSLVTLTRPGASIPYLIHSIGDQASSLISQPLPGSRTEWSGGSSIHPHGRRAKHCNGTGAGARSGHLGVAKDAAGSRDRRGGAAA